MASVLIAPGSGPDVNDIPNVEPVSHSAFIEHQQASALIHVDRSTLDIVGISGKLDTNHPPQRLQVLPVRSVDVGREPIQFGENDREHLGGMCLTREGCSSLGGPSNIQTKADNHGLHG